MSRVFYRKMTLSDKIIDRIKKYKGFKTDTELANHLKIKPNTVATWRSRNSIPFGKIIAFCESNSVSLDYIVAGMGRVARQGAECDTCIYNKVGLTGDDAEFAEFLKMARAVLQSGTAYSDTLIANIRLSHHAMETEKRLKGVEERLGKIEEKEQPSKEKPPRIRKGDNEAERETILKKRVACFC